MLPLWPLFLLLHLVLVLLSRFLGLRMQFSRSWLEILLVRRLVLHGHDFLLQVLLEWWWRLR